MALGFIKSDLCGRNSTMNIAIVFLFIFALLLLLLSVYYLVYYLVTTRRSNFIAHIRFNIVQGLFLLSILGTLSLSLSRAPLPHGHLPPLLLARLHPH